MLVTIVPSGASSCRSGPAASAGARAAPVIEQVSPSTLRLQPGVPARVLIRGRGFDTDSNTVSFGPYEWQGIGALANGTTLTVIIPDRMPGSGGAAPALWVPGAYALVVRNRRGASATVSVELQTAPANRP